MALDDILTIECGIVAIRIARVVRRTPDQTIDALIVTRDGNGELAAEWMTMTLAELSELHGFVERVIEGAHQRSFGEKHDAEV